MTLAELCSLIRTLVPVGVLSEPETSKLPKFERYDIPLMELRAERLSDMPTIRTRADRFEEETAPELTMVKRAKKRNRLYDKMEDHAPGLGQWHRGRRLNVM